MARRLDWGKDRRNILSWAPKDYSPGQVKKFRRLYTRQTWIELRAKTQALADAAAPKFDTPPVGDDGLPPWD